MIKLDAMENPYQWPESLRADLAERLAHTAFNRYPDPQANGVRGPLRAFMKIPDELEMLFGNGSDEIIALLIANLIGSGRSVCAPDPSFVMFQVLANQYSVPFRALPLDASLDIDLVGWMDGLVEADPALIFIPQPNNPTGNLFSKDRLTEIVESTQALVVIDEAYTAFTDADYLDWAVTYPNVVVMRTLSKVGLAGSRFGMLIGHPDWISEFEKTRLPYNINILSQTVPGSISATWFMAARPSVIFWPFICVKISPGRMSALAAGPRRYTPEMRTPASLPTPNERARSSVSGCVSTPIQPRMT